MTTDILTSSLLTQRPTSPTIWFESNKRVFALPLSGLKIDVELHVSTAVVRMRGSWINTSNEKVDCIFALPGRGIVSSVEVKIGSRVLETTVVSNDEVEEIRKMQDRFLGSKRENTQSSSKADQKITPTESPFEAYIPDLFRLPLPRILPADEVCLEVCYIESLTFDNSFYNFSIPLEFLPGMLPIDYNLNSLISINIASYSFSQETSFESSSHSLQLVKKQKNAVIITATPQGNTACNFNLRYRFLAEGITSTLIHQAAGSNQFDNRGSFVLFVTPPTANTANKFFNRNIIFLLDRSGSMTGEPFAEATKALIIAIESLQPGDKFSIVAFDHDQRIFSDSVLEASERQFDRARKWIELQAPVGGGTDIQTPLTWALQVLNSQVDKASQHLSCVVLITDGCVSEERNIVNRISKSIGESRIYTLGIGSYCNWFFLKILAQVGRGFDEVVVYREQICSQVQFLLKRASQAVLRDISLSISQITDCELYPYPLPDLFVNSPLLVTGKYEGNSIPGDCHIEGLDSKGSKVSLPVRVEHSSRLPIDRIFLKQRIDLLTAKAWLEESKELEALVVRLSKEGEFPSAFTKLVAFETTAESLEQQADLETSRLEDDAGSFVESELVPEPDESKEDTLHSLLRPKRRRFGLSSRQLGLLAGGGAVVVGAAAFSFGNLAASLDNLAIGSLGAEGIADGGNCCDDCDMDDCGAC